MKKVIKSIAIFSIVILMPLLLSAQPEPGQNGDGSEVGGLPVGGGAPIGSGLIIMMVMGAAYGAKKVYQINKAE
ncbi:MAG: hypothetical protein JW731_06260 [Bacteroidales bacterium]|nr:hypothetical protein [Bacteroidales bacterium]